MSTSPKVSIGFGTVAGALVSLAQLAGGVALIVLGKTAAEKEAGRLLIGGGSLTSTTVLAGRFAQAYKALPRIAGQIEDAALAYLPTLEEELQSPPPAETLAPAAA